VGLFYFCIYLVYIRHLSKIIALLTKKWLF
jgi:hypothetical protein